ncbi:phycocyanobilin lyase [Haladaptatus sp. R4]|uniref:HEAT repeat domain-containing protein n=1 Tax=Haladaptatus sp. R4 TaxID=1679489 RepID=UPI0007B4BF7E|nr:HEAT repeat domain-containing protein [Haladaptatus sp. R4]KZN23709.1 phycocyanobilin lyase [Haladaptatus sp. R4]
MESETEEIEESEEESEEETPEETAESIENRLESAEADLEDAETEADLDVVEEELDDIEEELEAADLPEPDEPDEEEDEDEDVEDPREELEMFLSDLRDELEDQRGPYAEDVIGDIEDAISTVEDTRWTVDGSAELVEVVESFVDTVQEAIGTDFSVTLTRNSDDLAEVLGDTASAVEEAELDPDEDAETIDTLLDATDELQSGIDDAEEWSDLSTREQLRREGYYDVLNYRKDYPPEWHALKIWEKRDRVDMVLLALDSLQSNYMERHCLEALERMGNEEAVEPMLQRAGRRDKDAIRILGKIGSEEAIDSIIDYVDADPGMAKTVIKALGEIGSEEVTQDVADQLVVEDEEVRSYAARSLGLIGDTRAIKPLSETLADDESDSVRASAAWALNQIGTETALDAVREYSDDRAYIVQSEAEKAL